MPVEKETFYMKASSSDEKLPEMIIKSAIIEEALSTLTRVRIEFLCKDRGLSLRGLLGQPMSLSFGTPDGGPRHFHGICTSAELIGTFDGLARFVAEVHPPLWLLTRRRDSRIFQGVTLPALIGKVIGDAGISANLQLNLDASYPSHDYRVQYRESDFAFVCRLMEEAGVYYYFTHDEDKSALVLGDGPGQHKAQRGGAKLEFVEAEVVEAGYGEQVFEWAPAGEAVSGKVSLVSYDFEKPGQKLLVSRSGGGGAAFQSSLELYDNDGRYITTDSGELRARFDAEAEGSRAQTWRGLSNSYRIAAGSTFTLTDAPRRKDPTDFLVTRATHYIQRQDDALRPEVGRHMSERGLQFGRHFDQVYRCEFEAIPKDCQFRPPRQTPWPKVGGVHTAVVTGPSGEEIHTDKYGRIKIQFHWDRKGKRDENTTIWVRTMMPWTGKSWGMIAVPRIGNEVVVQFEEGDPDRPIVIGMVYNGANMPPYELPANKTVSGVKTNSSKGGDGYNELIFEDKKNSELIRMHAERDYLQVVENNAKITIGKEKQKDGDLTQWVWRNRASITGLIDADATAGVKATAVGGAITESVVGVKTTTVGFHVYEKIGFSVKTVAAIAGVVGKQVAMRGAATPGDVAAAGDSKFFDDLDDSLGSTGVVKNIWRHFSGYGTFLAPAAAAVIGAWKAKGLKPGRTTEILGNSKLTIEKNGAAKGDSEITLKDGDLTTTVEKGNELTTIKKGKHTLHVETDDQIVTVDKGNRKITVGQGNVTTDIQGGNQTTTLDRGHQKTQVKLGNISVKADLGKIELEAMQKISLKVGPSSIEISPSGIKLEGMTINTKSKLMTEIDGGIMTTVKGTFVMIN